MKRTKIRNRLLFCSCLACGMLMSGCSDSDYDISSVDAKLGVGGSLSLPSDNSVIITLDDILNLGNTDLIKVLDNGDYQFGKDPESVSGVNVKVNEISNDGLVSNIPISAINLDASIMAYSGQVIKLSDYGFDPLKVTQNISTFNYSFDVPNDVKELEEIMLKNGGSDLNLTITLPSVKSISKFVIKLPVQLVLENKGIGTFDPATNILTLPAGTEVNQSTHKLELKFKVTSIKAQLDDNHQFILNGNVNLDVEVDEITVPSTTEVQFDANVTLATMTVSSAKGKFDPKIDAQNIGSTTINSLPDFLTDTRVVADVDNPQIWLTLESNLPLGGYVEAKLSSTTSSKDVVLSKANGNELSITANGTTRLVVCRKAPATLSGYTPVIAPDLSNIIRKLEEGMKINIDITKFSANNDVTTVELGKDYTFAPTYRFTAPLVLGDEAQIVYSDNEDDLHKDLKDLKLEKGAVLTVAADVNNKVPADLEINITPLGLDGKPISTLVVKPIQNKVAAGAAADKIKYEISDPNGTGLNQLDGIKYELLVTAPTASSEKGKVLNKTQEIVIKTTDLHLNGQVIVDTD